jgi:hypothetical protein
MVMISAGRNESGLAAVALGQRKSEHPAVEGERAVEIRDLEVDVTYPDGGIDRMRGPGRLERDERSGLTRHIGLT